MDMRESDDVKFGKKTERTTRESAEQLFDILEPVGTTEDPFEPTARCINDTKKKELVTRSGFPRLRCCVCHLHHKWAMKSPAAVRQFFKTVLRQVCHLRLMSLREMPMLQHTSTSKIRSTKICTILQLPSC